MASSIDCTIMRRDGIALNLFGYTRREVARQIRWLRRNGLAVSHVVTHRTY